MTVPLLRTPGPQETRTPEQLWEQYLVEKDLAMMLRSATKAERGNLYSSVYEELFRRVLALGIVLNVVLALGAAYFAQRGIGLFQVLGISGAAAFIVALLVRDGASYLVHRVMHQTPIL